MTEKTDVVIVGGGLNGTLVALALADAGICVTLVDAGSQKIKRQNDFDGRSYAISAASQRMFDVLGLWKDIGGDAQPMREIVVSDGQAGQGPNPFFLHFQETDNGPGPMGFMVEDRLLRNVLINRMSHPNIKIRFETTVAEQITTNTGATAILSTGDQIDCALIIGADGKYSQTAQRAGLRATGTSYDQVSVVAAIAHEKDHKGIAHQFFMETGPLAILPLTGKRSSIVWTETTEQARAILELDDMDFLEYLRPRFGDFLGEISLAGDRFSYPLELRLVYEMVANRVALVGDAAHAVHPLAGQGLNAGIKDCAALAEVVIDAKRRGLDIGTHSVLDEYQTWRRFDNASLAVATHSFNRLFSNGNSMLSAIRGAAMGAINAANGVRKSFVAEAAGNSGELPKLLQGKRI